MDSQTKMNGNILVRYHNPINSPIRRMKKSAITIMMTGYATLDPPLMN